MLQTAPLLEYETIIRPSSGGAQSGAAQSMSISSNIRHPHYKTIPGEALARSPRSPGAPPCAARSPPFCSPPPDSRAPAPLPEAKPEDVGVSSQRLERVTQAMQRIVGNGELAGMVVLVARQGKLVYRKSFG